MVSGVAALMLEANEDLTWRDVKHVLASTAVKVDQSFSATAIGGVDYVGWRTNAAGYNFHPWYGFGAVDAQAAVTAASNMTANSLGTLTESGWLYSSTLNAEIGPTEAFSAITLTGSGTVEAIRVVLYFNHAKPNHLGFRLQSPSGTFMTVLPPVTGLTQNPTNQAAVLLVNGFYGETFAGGWKLWAADQVNGTAGTLASWGIYVYSTN